MRFIVSIFIAGIALVGCSKSEQAAPSASTVTTATPKANTELAMPSFSEGEAYSSVRQKMLTAGWKHYTSVESICKSEEEAKKISECKETPELQSCAGNALNQCEFTWSDGQRIATIETFGDKHVFGTVTFGQTELRQAQSSVPVEQAAPQSTKTISFKDFVLGNRWSVLNQPCNNFHAVYNNVYGRTFVSNGVPQAGTIKPQVSIEEIDESSLKITATYSSNAWITYLLRRVDDNTIIDTMFKEGVQSEQSESKLCDENPQSSPLKQATPQPSSAISAVKGSLGAPFDEMHELFCKSERRQLTQTETIRLAELSGQNQRLVVENMKNTGFEGITKMQEININTAKAMNKETCN